MVGYGPVGYSPVGASFSSATVIEPPPPEQAWEPVTLAQAKAHLRVHLADDDAYIEGLIMAARMMLEGRINRAIVPQMVELTLDRFGKIGFDGITLPRVPYLDGLEVLFVDNAGNLDVLTDYYLETSDEPATLYPAMGQLFPLVTSGRGAVRIKYRAGYPSADAVPAPLKQWILLAIGTMYQHRETTIVGVSVTELPDGFMRMLWQPYMVYV